LDIYFIANNVINEEIRMIYVYVNPLDFSSNDTLSADLFIVMRGGPLPTYMKLCAFTNDAPVFEFATYQQLRMVAQMLRADFLFAEICG
jgi:hypothetical protein